MDGKSDIEDLAFPRMFEHGRVNEMLMSAAEGFMWEQRTIVRSSAGAESGVEGMA